MSDRIGSPAPWVRNNDPNVGPSLSAEQIVDDVAIEAGRAILVNCTGTGTFIYTLVNGGTITLNLTAGNIYEFNDAVVGVSSSGTATYTAWNKY